MTTIRNILIVMALWAFFFYSGWFVGRNGVNCPPCIESKSCPSEEIWVNTSFGLMHFEAGEIDQAPPYIFTREKMDEMFRKVEQEILKQKGEAL